MAVAPADVVVVQNAKELYDAVAGGTRDIVLKAHMDMTGELADDLGFILPLLPSTRSIQVRPHSQAFSYSTSHFVLPAVIRIRYSQALACLLALILSYKRSFSSWFALFDSFTWFFLRRCENDNEQAIPHAGSM